ncbi:MAG: 50S ribosomal protein L17 [Deltaproteobacteria bacterium]|nr:50S ribosomal protein L17 [Deltaproteobacteria bacterium]MBW1834916.1 50S ribosomal protein L17 [Deltaproteobacteria bacterium]MBW2165234.1 50S ribosomal protein L17 [Deltaproteobacteria bacterium]
MRHRKAGLKLNRTSSHRDAMFRNMVTSLFKYERIRTTDTKAKGLRRWADHLITLAKRGDLHARRQALSIIREKAVVYKLFSEANERFGTMSGGYTRIVKLGRRPGDAALVSMIELVTMEKEKSKKKKTKGKKSAAVEKKQVAEVAVEKVEPEKREEKHVEKIVEKKSAEQEEDTDKNSDEMELAAESKETVTEEDKDKPEDEVEKTELEK